MTIAVCLKTHLTPLSIPHLNFFKDTLPEYTKQNHRFLDSLTLMCMESGVSACEDFPKENRTPANKQQPLY